MVLSAGCSVLSAVWGSSFSLLRRSTAGGRTLRSSAMSPKATNSIAGGIATGLQARNHSDPERVASKMIFDPFRVGTILTSVPVAMPPAIEFDAFGVNRKPVKHLFRIRSRVFSCFDH